MATARQLLDPKGFARGHQSTQPSGKSRGAIAYARLRNGPRQIPKASFQKSISADSTDSLDSTRDDNDDFEAVSGAGSILERQYGVIERDGHWHKKQKVENHASEEEESKNRAFGKISKGGDLGEYVKAKRKEGAQEGMPENAIPPLVDLTTEDAEVTFVGEAEKDAHEVCYGRIDRPRVNAHLIPTPHPGTIINGGNLWPTMKLQLERRPGADNIIRVLDPIGRDFGTVDVRTALRLSRIMDNQSYRIRTQARLSARKRLPNQTAGRECAESFDMTINLYGPKNRAQTIGRWLSQGQVYLRDPITYDAHIELCNPHNKEKVLPRTSTGLNGVDRGNGRGRTSGYVTRTVEEIRNDVTGVFDSLQKSENLPEREADGRVITPLLSHQKQALWFLESKECERVFGAKEEDNNSLWRLNYKANGQRTYYNVITGNEISEKPPEVRGGILADMMGLGKTLSILSLVVGSLEASQQWAREDCPAQDGENTLIRNSKATLLIAPLSTLNNWEEQIATHIKSETLSYCIYHGAGRTSDIDELAEYDMVITTYAIVSSEWQKRGVTGRAPGKKTNGSALMQTNFFRIVLDEAHMIREQATRQSQAICSLSAQRRWAVTGTPVQNRLDDLGALIKFLRIKPFSDRGGFAQFILTPFKMADPEILPKLRLLVDSITLRRLKDRIDLPKRHDLIVRLHFSESEQKLYDWISKDSLNRMSVIAGAGLKSLGGRSYVHVLRAIMRLRLICAHGRELLSADDLKIIDGLNQDSAIELLDEDEPDDKANGNGSKAQRSSLAPRQAYEMLELARESDAHQCDSCGKAVQPRADGAEDVIPLTGHSRGNSNSESTRGGLGNHNDNKKDTEIDEVFGYMLPCYQLVCRDCMPEFRATVAASNTTDSQTFTCPFCAMSLPLGFFDLTRKGQEQAEIAREESRNKSRSTKQEHAGSNHYSGPHTKVQYLLDSLHGSAMESEALPAGQTPIKSVVFSGWTQNLDLIQIAFEERGIQYTRLDGRMARKARNAAMERFRTDADVRVMLISIGAGGLGLNLTSASKVYVMEPQFNPASESQAVDRIHRLGQKREVFVNRLIMENSFELKMLELQRKKQSLADLSMNRQKLDKAEAAKIKLEELRSLFK